MGVKTIVKMDLLDPYEVGVKTIVKMDGLDSYEVGMKTFMKNCWDILSGMKLSLLASNVKFLQR